MQRRTESPMAMNVSPSPATTNILQSFTLPETPQQPRDFMGFSISSAEVFGIIDTLPSTPHVLSIGSGFPPMEPKSLARLTGAKRISYVGLEYSKSEVTLAQKTMAQRPNFYGDGISATFVQVDLTMKLSKEYQGSADILMFGHPDVWGTQEINEGECGLLTTPPKSWERIFQNSLIAYKLGGLVICTTHAERETKVVIRYLHDNGFRILEISTNTDDFLDHAIVLATTQ